MRAGSWLPVQQSTPFLFTAGVVSLLVIKGAEYRDLQRCYQRLRQNDDLAAGLQCQRRKSKTSVPRIKGDQA